MISTRQFDWPEGSIPASLGSKDVHVWVAELDGSEIHEIAAAKQLLSPSERLRSEGFRARLHHDRYVTRTAVLRTLLASYLNCPPNSIQFDFGPRGKPEL